ncbi:hypothetical protein GCM10010385_06080 [Streptomyces geysiriensis]|nr:hypothetical protein GCM10010385_06080 [Streptomyces geysiriensis]GGZ78418.1 hypothetical protein GCM10010301_59660 [Streptomyces plicatus]GHC33906.1 hypothetical protein GCM10010308_60050 [Streptomyces vinaceusdrappus]
MGETDPFVCLLCLPEEPRPPRQEQASLPKAVALPARPPGVTLGSNPAATGSGWRIPT